MQLKLHKCNGKYLNIKNYNKNLIYLLAILLTVDREKMEYESNDLSAISKIIREAYMLRNTLVTFFICSITLFAQSHKELITGPFTAPQEVTKACLVCHETAAKEIMQTNHWTWLDEKYLDLDGKTEQKGKINFINKKDDS